jgi:hypothetical protein
MMPALAGDSSSGAYRAGQVAGRFFYLAFVPVFLIALVYWLSGRTRPQPMPFSHAISRWWVWVAGVVTGLLLLTGLGFALAAPAAQRQAALESTSKTVPEPTVPAGWTMQRDATDGFELALPDAWAKARADPRYFEADVASIGQAHPDVADVLRRLNQATAGKGLKLIAVDPSQPSGYYSSIIILMYDAGFGPSLDTTAGDYVSGIEENSQVVKPVTKEKVTLPVGPAVRVDARSTPINGLTIAEVSYVLLHGKQGKSYGIVVLFAGASDQLPTMQTTIKQAIESFRYLS